MPSSRRYPSLARSVLCAAALLLFPGCSDEGGSDGPGETGGVSGSAGGSGGATGGSSGSGGATGGSAGSGEEQCTGQRSLNPYGSNMSNCGDGIRNIALDAPLAPGSSFAFSTELATSDGAMMELWGTNEECGEPLELLDTEPMGDGIRCMEGTPQQGSYTHLLWVWEGGGSHSTVYWCDDGTCE